MLEISDREAEGVVDPGDEPRPRLGQVDQPVSDLLPVPVPTLALRDGGGRHRCRSLVLGDGVDLQLGRP